MRNVIRLAQATRTDDAAERVRRLLAAGAHEDTLKTDPEKPVLPAANVERELRYFLVG